MSITHMDAESSKTKMTEIIDKGQPALLMFVDEDSRVGYMAAGITVAHVAALLGVFQTFSSRVLSQFIEEHVTLHMASKMMLDTGPKILEDAGAIRQLMVDGADMEPIIALLDRITASAIKLDVLTRPLEGLTDEDEAETPVDGDDSPEPPHTVDGDGTGDDGAEVCDNAASDREPGGDLRMAIED